LIVVVVIDAVVVVTTLVVVIVVVTDIVVVVTRLKTTVNYIMLTDSKTSARKSTKTQDTRHNDLASLSSSSTS